MAAFVVLSGCGTAQSPATQPTVSTSTTTTTTPTVQRGPVAFVEWAKTAELGTRDPSAASDAVLLNVGNRGCDVLIAQPSFGQAVQTMTEELKSYEVTAAQMDAWFRVAVANLRPRYKSVLP